MNKFFVYAVMINVALLVFFVISDYETWNAVAANLIKNYVFLQQLNESEFGPAIVTDIYSNYGILGTPIGMNIRYAMPNNLVAKSLDASATTGNLPLGWFITAIVVNLSLIWHLEKKRMSKLTEDSKTEATSERGQKLTK
jgi:hypothetical protein